MSVDSEYQLFRILPANLSNKIELSVYNRRKANYLFLENHFAKNW